MKQLAQAAEAAKKAVGEHANLAKQPQDEKSDAAMERADALVSVRCEVVQGRDEEDAGDLKQALEAARQAVDPTALAKAEQVANQAAASKVPDLLEKRAEKALAGQNDPKGQTADAKAKEAAEVKAEAKAKDAANKE